MAIILAFFPHTMYGIGVSSPQQDVAHLLCSPGCLRQLATEPSLTVCLHQPMVNRHKLPTLSRVPDHTEPVVIYEHNAIVIILKLRD